MIIPESVSAYLHDAGTRRAINGLRDVGAGDILDGLEWSELPRFYRALQAARQFETEWAILGCELWEATWSGLLPGWHSLSPDEQISGDYDAGLAIEDLLDTGDGSLWFGRVLTARGWTLYAAVVGVPGQGFVVKVSCATNTRATKFLSIAAGPDDIGNWVSAPVATEEGAIDTNTLRAIAAQAVTSLPDFSRFDRRGVVESNS